MSRVGLCSCSHVRLVMDVGKHKRIQFVECPNDINGMVDCAKVADLALLLIDGSYGFEMVRRAIDDCFSLAFSFFFLTSALSSLPVLVICLFLLSDMNKDMIS